MNVLHYFKQQLSFMKQSRDALAEGAVKDECSHKIEVLEEVVSVLYTHPPAKVPEAKGFYCSAAICCGCGHVYMERPSSCDCGNDESINGFESAAVFIASDITTPTPATTPEAECPKGWKLVPIEPTKEMCDAAQDKFEHGMLITYQQMYRSMIAASPTPPQEQ